MESSSGLNMVALVLVRTVLFSLLQSHRTVLREAPIRSRSSIRQLRASEADDASAAARLLQKPTAASGFDAFAGTAWQILMQMDVGGTAMFSVELLEDTRCRFSDTDLYGALASTEYPVHSSASHRVSAQASGSISRTGWSLKSRRVCSRPRSTLVRSCSCLQASHQPRMAM